MRVIIGCGNELRGEDAFGVDVLKELQKLHLPHTKLISTHQLTPEISLELLDAHEIIFIDAAYDIEEQYTLSCPVLRENGLNISHHIEPRYLMEILKSLYNKTPNFCIYSMASCSFETIKDEKKYKSNVEKIVSYLSKAENK